MKGQVWCSRLRAAQGEGAGLGLLSQCPLPELPSVSWGSAGLSLGADFRGAGRALSWDLQKMGAGKAPQLLPPRICSPDLPSPVVPPWHKSRAVSRGGKVREDPR